MTDVVVPGAPKGDFLRGAPKGRVLPGAWKRKDGSSIVSAFRMTVDSSDAAAFDVSPRKDHSPGDTPT